MPRLKHCAAIAAALILIVFSAAAQTPAQPSSAAPPSGDQTELLKNTEGFIRKLFAWGPDYKVKLGPVAPSASPDFYLVPLSVTINEQTDTGTVFVSKDGKTFLRGEIFDTSKDPYADNVKKIHIEGNPTLGPATAKVTMVEYSDFECPHCRELYENLKTVLAAHPEVRFVAKDFPLTQIHPWAETAAIAARCAYIQNPDAFWKFSAMIFENQDLISAENAYEKLNDFAAQSNLDPDAFRTCMSSKEAKDAVQANQAEGISLNVTSTPTLFINGRPVPGGDKSTILQYLNYESTPTPTTPK